MKVCYPQFHIPVCSTSSFTLTISDDLAVAEVGIRKLRHALKVLSETEKQLRTSRNKATWVTVALLQFGTNESDLVAETNDIHAHSATGYTGQYNQIYYLYWSPTE
jgi:hypothetical protein